MNDTTKPTGLELMRAPFEEHQISLLPKETRAQIDERKANSASSFTCPQCKGWHHKRAIHLDYVGHAAVTDRLLDADLAWNWEPKSWNPDGEPHFDNIGGLWILLTVCGVTRLGYGNADKKMGADMGSREKEVIGDALRNAAMRFGAALDLWHKGDLHKTKQPETFSDDPRGDDGSVIDGHPADVRERQDSAETPSQSPPAGRTGELAPYPKDRFAADFPTWKAAVEAGQKTAAQVLTMVGTKGTLNPLQKAKIEALRPAK